MEAFITYRKRFETPDAFDGAPLDMEAIGYSRLIDLLAASKLDRLLLRGNEPALHPELGQFLDLALKKQIVPVVETCGVFPEDIGRLLRDSGVPVVFKIYDERIYSEEIRAALLENIGTFTQSRNNLTGFLISCAGSSLSSLTLDLIERYPAQDITFRLENTREKEAMAAFTQHLVPRICDLRLRGTRVLIDCGIPPCAYTDADYGKVGRFGIRRSTCDPKPGIRPDLKVYHCLKMLDLAAAPIHRFKRMDEIIRYFYQRHNQLQWDLRAYPECQKCPSLHVQTCNGVCMVHKADTLEQELAEKRRIVAEEENLEALVEAGVLSHRLNHIADAIEYLTEARRVDPSRADIHLFLARAFWDAGDLKTSEEEYHKAARIASDGRNILAELAGRFEAKGSLFKARRLAEEIRRMEPLQES